MEWIYISIPKQELYRWNLGKIINSIRQFTGHVIAYPFCTTILLTGNCGHGYHFRNIGVDFALWWMLLFVWLYVSSLVTSHMHGNIMVIMFTMTSLNAMIMLYVTNMSKVRNNIVDSFKSSIWNLLIWLEPAVCRPFPCSESLIRFIRII